MSEVERAEYAFTQVERWLRSEPMVELLGMFADGDGGEMVGWLHLNEELPGWLDGLFQDAEGIDGPFQGAEGITAQGELLRHVLVVERAAAGAFNFRTPDGSSYRERSQAVSADFDDATRERIARLADELGLVEAREPRFRAYDKTLVLGGGYRSPLLRTKYAALLRERGTQLGEVSFLGSPRFLIEDAARPERPVAERYAPGATDEFGLMLGAARAELGLRASGIEFLCGCTSDSEPCPKWPYREAENADRTPAEFTHERRAPLTNETGEMVGSVLSACTSRPPYRPDTSDTLGLWARCAEPRAGQRVLLVTTQVFVPFQQFDALRRIYLPYGAEVETVGFGPEWGDRPQNAEYLLQETLSAIRSARRLLVAAAKVLAPGALGSTG
ncbi:hypothetical protein [Dactylosporangium darangshiense]|uniref:hypothetical protein n=1 Tax=Dactylosporangium darangshiense TaxID=579108 RepID=UPI00362F9E04